MARQKKTISLFTSVQRRRARNVAPAPEPVKVSEEPVVKEYGFEAMAAIKAIRRAKTIDEFTEFVTNKPVRRKHPGTLYKQKVVAKTGKPYCTGWGMVNPIKLNISEETLNAIRKRK